jgi:ubiquinone/menaquinone biosynthesis C-methylase UbiE
VPYDAQMDLNNEWIKTAIVFYDSKVCYNPPQKLLLFKKAYRTLKKRINIKSGTIILDLGCGCGQITGALSPSEVTIIGIDISKNSIKQAKSFYPQSNFLCADMNNVPFKKNTFDIITAISSLEFCFDKARILRVVKEKLRDNGRLYIEVRNNDFIVYRLMRPLFSYYKIKFFIKDYPAKGFRDLGYDEWVDLFRNSGLSVKKTYASVRPWNYGSLETRIKNFIIMITRYLVPLKYHYMIGFVLKKYQSKS